MHDARISNEPQMRATASEDLIVALDLLLQNAGACLTHDQRIEVLLVIIAAGCAVRKARRNEPGHTLRLVSE